MYISFYLMFSTGLCYDLNITERFDASESLATYFIIYIYIYIKAEGSLFHIPKIYGL